MKIDMNGDIKIVYPVIISASRSTDMPAFYAKWFMNRLEAGYCNWKNMFNQQWTRVSFEKCKAIVFWTKNPRPMLPYLSELDRRGLHYYFQVTLNDYVQEGFEPNVPSVEERVRTFRELSNHIGPDRVIWRFDPLIVTPALTAQMLLGKIKYIGEQLKGCTNKLVFSFIDVAAYKKVQNNLVKAPMPFTKNTVLTAELTELQRNQIVHGLVKMREEWKRQGWNLTMATCAEGVDLDKYGIKHNCCIDGELMEGLWKDDEEFVYYLRTGKFPVPDLFGNIPPIPEKGVNLKDKGQRKECGCMMSKDIGMYDTCRHFCVYCYANRSRECVLRNKDKHTDDSESIIG